MARIGAGGRCRWRRRLRRSAFIRHAGVSRAGRAARRQRGVGDDPPARSRCVVGGMCAFGRQEHTGACRADGNDCEPPANPVAVLMKSIVFLCFLPGSDSVYPLRFSFLVPCVRRCTARAQAPSPVRLKPLRADARFMPCGTASPARAVDLAPGRFCAGWPAYTGLLADCRSPCSGRQKASASCGRPSVRPARRTARFALISR